jgi:hypothetical protein
MECLACVLVRAAPNGWLRFFESPRPPFMYSDRRFDDHGYMYERNETRVANCRQAGQLNAHGVVLGIYIEGL